jgi:hypothetical protein
MVVYREGSHGGQSFTSVSGGKIVCYRNKTYSSHPLHPHLTFKNSYNAFRADSLELLMSVSTRKTIVSRKPLGPCLHQTFGVSRWDGCVPCRRDLRASNFMMRGDTPIFEA